LTREKFGSSVKDRWDHQRRDQHREDQIGAGEAEAGRTRRRHRAEEGLRHGGDAAVDDSNSWLYRRKLMCARNHRRPGAAALDQADDRSKLMSVGVAWPQQPGVGEQIAVGVSAVRSIQ